MGERDYAEILSTFENQTVAVLGDVFLDRFTYGKVSRINPEAPVPVFNPEREENVLGGAANVAANIVSLGGNVVLYTQLGADEDGAQVEELLEDLGIGTHITRPKGYQTIRKHRLIAQSQQLIRIDTEEKRNLESDSIRAIITSLKELQPDIILVSDYAKGFITKELCALLSTLKIPVLVDPKTGHEDYYQNLTLITPNTSELRSLSGIEDPETAAKALREKLNLIVIGTKGDEGATIYAEKITHVPTRKRFVYDVVGAGDTFIAALSLSYNNADIEQAVRIANAAAGLAVEKPGTATVSKHELAEDLSQERAKATSRDFIKEKVAHYQSQGKKVVFTNGCFDILHSGHLKILTEAKGFGDVLIVGLNSDESVKRLKGPTRPVNDQEERATVLLGVGAVDYVTVFEEDTPVEIISELKPDVHVKGGDYNPNNYEQMPEAKVVHEYGGEVKIVPIVKGKSTTKTIERSKQ